MARITVEDCLNQVDNRFGLIHLAAKRVRQLKKDAEPVVVCKNKDIVVALREIAAGKVFQTKDTLWVNPYVVYSDFNAMVPHIPIDSRTYLQSAAGLTGGVPSCE